MVFLDLGVLQDFLVEMGHWELRVSPERKDFQGLLEDLDQRVTQEIQVSLVPSSTSMEVMPEVLKVTMGILVCLDSLVTLGLLACMDLPAHLA